jgi:hypothetical protein
MPSVNRDNLTVRSSIILKLRISLVRPSTPSAGKWLPQGQKPALTVARYGPHRGQCVCSEDPVCGSDGELKTYPDRRMVASGFEQ